MYCFSFLIVEKNFAFQVDSHYCIIVIAVFFFLPFFFSENVVLFTSWCYLPLGVIYQATPSQGICEVCVDKEHLVHPRWTSFPCSLEWSSSLWESKKKNLWFHDVHTWDGQFVTEITFSFTLQKSTFKPAALFWQHRLQFVSATVYQTWCRYGCFLVRVYFIF